MHPHLVLVSMYLQVEGNSHSHAGEMDHDKERKFFIVVLFKECES